MKRTSRPSSPSARRTRLECEELEPRIVPSAASFHAVPAGQLVQPAVTSGTVVGYTPAQIRQAYGFAQLPASVNGSGETIAIVDVTNDPNILGDANYFSNQFGLPQFNTSGGPTFTKVNEYGSTTGLPRTVNSSWSGEIAMDVEWAHAIAPAANILLVEANSTNISDLTTAINTARNRTGVVAVSMSWGGAEFPGISSYDQYLTTPTGHPGVTFVAATLDNGAYYHGFSAAYWPAVSPNVLAVGGTTLQLNAAGDVLSQTGWSGSGGGFSRYESQPAYQTPFVSSSTRANPDVAYNADYNTGVAVYDTVPYNRQTGWLKGGGTSAGTPQWAALVTLADQERALQGLPSLDGPTQTLYALYAMASTSYGSYFNDITSGNNGYPAGQGYDLVTGLGTPIAWEIISALESVKGAGPSLVL